MEMLPNTPIHHECKRDIQKPGLISDMANQRYVEPPQHPPSRLGAYESFRRKGIEAEDDSRMRNRETAWNEAGREMDRP